MKAGRKGYQLWELLLSPLPPLQPLCLVVPVEVVEMVLVEGRHREKRETCVTPEGRQCYQLRANIVEGKDS